MALVLNKVEFASHFLTYAKVVNTGDTYELL